MRTVAELEGLPPEELRELSLQKRKNGNATSEAIAAQRILHARSGHTFDQHSHREGTADIKYQYGDPNRFTKRFSQKRER